MWMALWEGRDLERGRGLCSGKACFGSLVSIVMCNQHVNSLPRLCQLLLSDCQQVRPYKLLYGQPFLEQQAVPARGESALLPEILFLPFRIPRLNLHFVGALESPNATILTE